MIALLDQGNRITHVPFFGIAEVSTAAFNTTSGVWDSLMATLFVSKLELIRDFLTLCRTASQAFKCETVGQNIPTGEVLIRPVKKYVTEYVQLMILCTGPRHLAALSSVVQQAL